ncbi:MAG: hypothetical protein H0W82_08865 [Actinobacteria bacterium]|nr:hypothetical protein [Actinomycetota bacterium]
MFIRYFIELPIPADRVTEVMCASPASWIPGLAEEANAHGERLLAEVGLGDRLRLTRRVVVDLGRPMRFPSRTVIPLRWRPETEGGLLPALDADVEVAPLAQGSTQLSMSARYLPPWGALGSAVDRALLHRVAEATVKDFLDRVGSAVTTSAATTNRPATMPT